MFKKLISFATILLSISFNNSESSSVNDINSYYWYLKPNIYAIPVNYKIDYNVPVFCLGFHKDCFHIKMRGYSLASKTIDGFVDMLNGEANESHITVDSIDYDKNSDKVIFRGIKTVESCKYIGLEGLNNFKPNIIFDCENNKVKFTKIVGNNINSFKLISKNPIKIKSWISVDPINNKMKVHNTKHKPIIGAISVTPHYSYFELSLKAE